MVLVTAARVQDRVGGIRVFDRVKMAMSSLALTGADAAYSRHVQDFAARPLRIGVQVVAELVGQRSFVSLPRRWVLERTHAGPTAHGRMSRDCERLPAHAEAMIKWAMIDLMAHRLPPALGRRPWQPATAACPLLDTLLVPQRPSPVRSTGPWCRAVSTPPKRAAQRPAYCDDVRE